MDNEICEARVGFSRHAAWVLHVIRFGLGAAPVANIAHGVSSWLRRLRLLLSRRTYRRATRVYAYDRPGTPVGEKPSRSDPDAGFALKDCIKGAGLAVCGGAHQQTPASAPGQLGLSARLLLGLAASKRRGPGRPDLCAKDAKRVVTRDFTLRADGTVLPPTIETPKIPHLQKTRQVGAPSARRAARPTTAFGGYRLPPSSKS